MARFAERTIVVTGGGSGIGRATAVMCAREGASVIVIDRDRDALASVQAEMATTGATSRAELCDVVDSAAVERLFRGIEHVDGLVNCAGIAQRFRLGDQEETGWDAILNVNLKGLYLTTRHALPRMRSGGSIVHLSSAVALIGVRNRAAYTASKGAITALTRNMALDYASRGIRVNCVSPGFTRTNLTRGIFADPVRLSRIEAMHPLGRMGQAEDIAGAILFLLSDDASWITGIVMPVDGGFSAGHMHDV